MHRFDPSDPLRLCLIGTGLLGLIASTPAATEAQRTPPAATADEEEELTEEEEEASEEAPTSSEEGSLRLRAPSVGVARVAPTEDEEDEELDEEEEEAAEPAPVEEDEDEDEEEALPSPDDAARELGSTSSDPTEGPWTTPQTVFELHGYMRMRGEFQDQFFLGRTPTPDATSDLPFSIWRPTEDGVTPSGGCSSPYGGSMPTACDQNALAYANMRLRIEPTVHLSDDVRVRMQIDALDNMVLGSAPEGYALNTDGSRFVDQFGPITADAQTVNPPISGRNSITDSIVVRRAWAEVRNRGLGELRFGRMGNHWGLGILNNDGRGIDQDYQSDVDRIMATTRIMGFYVMGAWDFASEGYLYQDRVNYQIPAFDRARLDDVDQMTFAIARRSTPEEQQQALERHEVVVNAGAYFVYRTQNLTTEGTSSITTNSPTYVRRGFESYTPDLWAQILYEDLRLELEAVAVLGTIENTSSTTFDASTRLDLRQFGIAFEGEYRLLNDQLGIYFNAGYASGDADAEGISRRSPSYNRQLVTPNGTDRTASTFSFNPAYRVDLILYRNILGSIAGSYYFRPGLSYDFIRNSFGQLMGVRADVIWSRASEPVQTWGNAADLGVEIDVAGYYRSEDGPDFLDGFYASVQGGILFPLAGLGYLPGTFSSNTPGGQNALTLRLVLGVQY